MCFTGAWADWNENILIAWDCCAQQNLKIVAVSVTIGFSQLIVKSYWMERVGELQFIVLSTVSFGSWMTSVKCICSRKRYFTVTTTNTQYKCVRWAIIVDPSRQVGLWVESGNLVLFFCLSSCAQARVILNTHADVATRSLSSLSSLT